LIAKKGSTRKRRLGVPSWSDKLVQEVIRLILDAYYDPQFSDHSHGFRPSRGCHSALQQIRHVWKGTVWFIEGDIAQCFDTLDHQVLLDILAEKIHDNRFLRLITGVLRAGYLEDWTWYPTVSGSPQGGIISPILANIYLDRLDQYVAQTLLPIYNQGTRRQPNNAYRAVGRVAQRWVTTGQVKEAREARKQLQKLPSQDTQDPTYRRLRYLRYADDVRHITRCQIPFTERRGTEEITSGSTAYPAAKAKGDRSMPVKRERPEGAYGLVSQDPRDRVKTGLFEPQSPAMQAYILRSQRLKPSHPDRAAKSSSPEASAGWAVRNDRTQGGERGTYVALDTSGTVGMWDRPPRREAQGDGAAIVVRAGKSPVHGEGRQVL
jgi:hypothetical protein